MRGPAGPAFEPRRITCRYLISSSRQKPGPRDLVELVILWVDRDKRSWYGLNLGGMTRYTPSIPKAIDVKASKRDPETGG